MRKRFLLLPGPAALLALWLVTKLGLSPLKNYDLFFHLAGGRFVLEHGFTRVDPFSLTGTAGWVPHEWGFGVACVLLVKLLGAAGPALFVAGLVAANVLVLWAALGRAASGPRGLLAVATLVAMLAVQSPTWPQERPYHLGHLLFAFAVMAVLAWRGGNDRVLWAFPVLGVLWANVHGSWLLGPALLGATAVGQALDVPTPESRKRSVKALGFCVAMFLAAGLGPDGTAIYLYPLHHSVLPSTQTIVEWRPLDLDMGASWAYLALFGATLFAVGQSPTRKVASLLPTLVLGIAALKVQRHAPFAGVLLGLALLEHAALSERQFALPAALRRILEGVDRRVATWSATARGNVWPAVVLAGLVTVHARTPLPIEAGVRHATIPLKVFEALRKLPPGKVLNRFVIGGPISYFAGADYKVFIDSRNDPFPMAIHDDYERLVWSEPGWEDVLTRYDPDYLVWDTVNPGNILLDHLRTRGGWREASRDGEYVLWIRERAATATPP
ncbi:hypothetical protein JGU66_14290 [Myxococcaceae bacterium JPH2]|nr:hypothetical protein [Myxococcaceae bacterium JPH2]